jgi:hypothetical protein
VVAEREGPVTVDLEPSEQAPHNSTVINHMTKKSINLAIKFPQGFTKGGQSYFKKK